MYNLDFFRILEVQKIRLNVGRIAAIDFGLKRMGIAISDEGKKIAFPAQTVPGGPKAVQEVQKAFAGKTIDLILLGLPLLLNGKEGPMADLVKKFAVELEAALKIPIRFIDERFSSKVADQSLRLMQLNRKERSALIDATTATMLLQGYLDNPSI